MVGKKISCLREYNRLERVVKTVLQTTQSPELQVQEFVKILDQNVLPPRTRMTFDHLMAVSVYKQSFCSELSEIIKLVKKFCLMFFIA